MGNFRTEVKLVLGRIQKDIRNYYKAIIFLLLFCIFLSLNFHSICLMAIFTGFPCPACGITRAFYYVITGKFTLAFQMHPLIYIYIAFFIFLILYRYILGKEFKKVKILFYLFLASLFVTYFIRMYFYFPNSQPMVYYHGNLIENVILFLRTS